MATAEESTGPDSWGEVLGLEMIEVGPERVTARLDASPRHHQPYGILHGGVYCSIVEAVASHGAGQAARTRGYVGVVGTSNHTDFLRSHSEGELLVVAEPLHVGRQQQLWEVLIRRTSDSKLVARGQVRFTTLNELPTQRRQQASASDG